MKDERRGASGGEKLTWSESVGDARGLMSQLGHCDLLHTGEEGWPLCSDSSAGRRELCACGLATGVTVR